MWPDGPGINCDRRIQPRCLSGELESAFLFVSDLNVLFGFGEPQAAGSFNNSALKARMLLYDQPGGIRVVVFLRRISADGATPTGKSPARRHRRRERAGFGAAFQATYS